LTLYENQIFDNFEQFEKQLEEYSKEKCQILTVTHSQFNVDQKPESGYKYCEYKCIKYKDITKTKTNSSGLRPTQNYYASSCPVKYRINLEAAGPHKGKYKLRKIFEQHNHQLCKDDFIYHSKQRQLNDAQKQQAITMYQNKSKVK
jgi:hypothetical protein